MSAFLIVKTYPRLSREYAGRYQSNRAIYALPRLYRRADASAIQYRGLDREPLSALPPFIERTLVNEGDTFLLAEVRMAELEAAGRADRTHLADGDDAREVCSWIEEEDRSAYEIVWARVAGSARRVPAGFRSIGFEPSTFPEGHFSASCDCMVLPRWYGTDEGGTLFLPFFARLNPHGLFSSAADAMEFLRYYRAYEWTERGTHQCVEVFIEHKEPDDERAMDRDTGRRRAGRAGNYGAGRDD